MNTTDKFNIIQTHGNGMGRTSIPCSGGTRDYLKDMKEEQGKDWDSFLLDLAEHETSQPNNSNELSYDDVKGACASAIRDELPVERMGR